MTNQRMRPIPALSPADRVRLLSKIYPNGDSCWEWRGTVDTQGYGRFTIRSDQYRAHRVVYSHLNGDIPQGTVTDHLCRNRRCVNPEHVEHTSVAVNTMRGESPQARNARKSCCPQGHEYARRSFLYKGERVKYRYCPTCQRSSSRAASKTSTEGCTCSSVSVQG